jgi:2,3-bisphosphoglycerate-dependent phosphoglycerate mutase
MRLYFIRHAQSANNWMYDVYGETTNRSEDPEVTELGLRQANLLASFLAHNRTQDRYLDGSNSNGFRITHLYSSLMVRALTTASVISQTARLPVLGYEDLHECGGIYLEDETTHERVGKYGKSRQYLESRFPKLIFPESSNPDGWWNRPYEDQSLCFQRAQRVVQTLIARHAETTDVVAVISHGGFYNEFIAALLGEQVKEYAWFQQHNTGITRIDFSSPSFEIVYMNRLDHLPHSLIT